MTLSEWVSSFKQTETERVLIWKATDRARQGWISKMTVGMKGVFGGERKAMIEALRSANSVGAIESSSALVIQSRQPVLENFLESLYIGVGSFFAQRTIDRYKSVPVEVLTKDEMDIVEREILRWLSGESGTKIKDISDTTLTRIRVQIANGVAEGESIDLIKDRIDRLYLEQIIPFRSEVIARTEVISANNLGSQAGAKATGIPLVKDWLSTKDDRTRPEHIEADGQTRGLDEPYIVAGDRLMFPGDSSLGARPGNIIQCRCTEIYRRA